jgi:hypothetical protein
MSSQPSLGISTKALIALALCLSAALLAVRWYRARKPLFFFLAFFFVALAPTSNLAILIGSIMAERFVYLPSIGLAGCVVAAICTLGRQVPRQRLLDMRAAWIALGLLCLACAARTYARNSDWLDDRSLWTSAEDVCPGSAKVHNNLGHSLTQLPGRGFLDVADGHRIGDKSKELPTRPSGYSRRPAHRRTPWAFLCQRPVIF